MKINRIDRIVNLGIFRDHSWDATLDDFQDYNLIYGWNGSGKTTLSSLFRYLEKGAIPSDVHIDIQIDSRSFTQDTLFANGAAYPIRVFNKEFVEESVFNESGEVAPIYYFGKESADAQKKVSSLKAEIGDNEKSLEESERKKLQAEKDLDSFCIEKAKLIKLLLTSSGVNSYNTYDKGRFKTRLLEIERGGGSEQKRLDSSAVDRLVKQKDSPKKDQIQVIQLDTGGASTVMETTRSLLTRSVLSQTIEALKSDASLGNWVAEGLKQHKQKSPSTCLFCGQTLPAGLLARLEEHFSDHYSSFVTELDGQLNALTALKERFDRLRLPDKASLYDHLGGEFADAVAAFQQKASQFCDLVAMLADRLQAKRTDPFSPGVIESLPTEFTVPDLNAINAIIKRHNQQTSEFEKQVAACRVALEEHYLADSLSDFQAKASAAQSSTESSGSLRTALTGLRQAVSTLEKEIIEHRRPADELNEDLRTYLGRDDLKFSIQDGGYLISRGAQQATHLSEGERTAIAFLYFLKSLSDKNFNSACGVIVIDDPVSSLDSNSLYHAFGFMKERTKNCGQLIVLTHSFDLFRQIRNWFHYVDRHPKRTNRKCGFFMLKEIQKDGKRHAKLSSLDRLLRIYESEYHYLFSLIRQCATSTNSNGLDTYYPMPNVARRLLEAFLSFRRPKEVGDLQVQLDSVSFDVARKTRVLRFLHTHSHNAGVAEPGHDLSILAETPAVLSDILDLMKTEDPVHFQQMLDVCPLMQGGGT